MNIAEILKKCPKGTKLYSPVYGEVEFVEVVDNRDDYYISCVNKRGFYESFAIDGRLLPLFPILNVCSSHPKTNAIGISL